MQINYHSITSDEALKGCCENALKAEYIALDTEFIRIRTYYPALGLIQLYDGQNVSLIDPLMINNWQPFCQLLVAPNVIKFLHASSEDLEVFNHSFSVLPTPFIDTQVLASFCGYPLSCGYAALIQDKLGIELDKSETRTDWLARPLTEKQCHYAAADVYYLFPIIEKLIKEVRQKGWLDAAKDECNQLVDKKNNELDSQLAYFDISNAWQLQGYQLGALQKLAQWRLDYARKKDMAINFVVKEESLFNVAKSLPKSLHELESLGLSGPEIRFHGRTMLELVNKAKQLKSEDLPEPIVRIIDYPNYKKVFKRLKDELQVIATEVNLPVELLASRRQINQLLKWHWQPEKREPLLFTGWRNMLVRERLSVILSEF